MLAPWFGGRGREIVVLSRGDGVVPGARFVWWDGEALGDWVRELDGADVLINLAGRSVDCRYTTRNRAEIMNSRVLSTRVLGEAVKRCAKPPRVWMNSSTATIYKHRFDVANDEETGEIGATAEAKDAFSVEVARAWEEEFARVEVPGTRRVVLRAAMVFGSEPGGVYSVMRRLVRLGLGGKMGDGRQFVSWIHANDFCRAIEWLLDHDSDEGVYNICAPNPIPNSEMMSAFRGVCKRLVGLPAARWMLEIGAFFMRTETELIIKSRRVVPGRLLAEGFAFEFPDMKLALLALERRIAGKAGASA